MGINSTNVAYGFGQMGSGHITTAEIMYPPTGRVIVAITMLEAVSFFADTGLVAETTYAPNAAAAVDDGVSFFGTGTQYATNGHDNASTKAVESEAVANDVVFPAGLTVYGRWSSMKLKEAKTHGVIVYYGQ